MKRPLNALPLALLVLTACEKPSATVAPVAPVNSSAASVADASSAANAGLALELRGPTEVEEGKSFDVECVVTGAGDAAVKYLWTYQGVQPRLVVAPNAGAKQTLTAPEWVQDTDLVIAVKASVGTQSVERELKVRLRADDDPPVAEISAPKWCECGELVALVGQSHNERLQETSPRWTQLGDGPRVTLDVADRLQTQFLAPEHDGPYSIEMELAVSDAGGGVGKATARIDVTCDPGSVPLPKGSELELVASQGVENPLPRGAWVLAGSVELEPSGEGPVESFVRFGVEKTGAALKLVREGDETQLSVVLLEKSPEGAWIQPPFNRVVPLGPFPSNVPLGFEFESDGREVKVRIGPAGAREQWQEMPFDIYLLLDRRPRHFAVDALGGSAKLGRLVLKS
ncbi:MAG: hypothetical protein HUU28_08715 [Planctomycetaceae bacterium]|nr:hypothetical protein [Planctomycetaceae bacterium]